LGGYDHWCLQHEHWGCWFSLSILDLTVQQMTSVVNVQLKKFIVDSGQANFMIVKILFISGNHMEIIVG
jgi:hypothetical protein